MFDPSIVDSLLARGDLKQARATLEQQLDRQPDDRATLMRLIDVLSAQRETNLAVRRAEQLLALAPADADARFYLAKAAFARGGAGDIARAAALIAGLQATPAVTSPVFQLLRGNVLAVQGHFAAAEAAYLEALALDAGLFDAQLHLGMVLRQQGNLPAARDALATATRQAPQVADAWLQLAAVQAGLGEISEALASYQRGLSLDPSRGDAWYATGALLAETFQFAPARQCLERALQVAPSLEDARNLLGFVLAELGETAAARATLAPDAAASPARVLRHALLLPQVYRDTEDLAANRQRYADSLEQLAAETTRWCPDPSAVFRFAQTNFLLAYQGGDDLALQAQYAGVLHQLIGRARPDLQQPIAAPAQHGRRIRVVFVSSFFRQCTVGNYFRSWVESLDADRFERIVMHTGWQLDEFATALASRCDRVVLARGGALQVAAAIRAEQADILIYPEIGMGAMNYLLANMRLAPVQCAAWGHPVTTGSSEIDVYFSCEAMEPAGVAAHYRERLLLLPGIGTSYAQPADVVPAERAALGLPSDRHLYVCPQSLFKIHPDNDRIYLDLMDADPQAVVVFFQAAAAAVTRDFADRLGRQMAARGIAPRGQVKFLPRMDEAGFRTVLDAADVVLDTLHWSGGNTSLDALAVGAPIVSLPGRFMRGRQTQAMLNAVGVPELVVTCEAALVERAVALAADLAARQALRQRLLAGRGALFDRAEPVATLAGHLTMLFEGG